MGKIMKRELQGILFILMLVFMPASLIVLCVWLGLEAIKRQAKRSKLP